VPVSEGIVPETKPGDVPEIGDGLGEMLPAMFASASLLISIESSVSWSGASVSDSTAPEAIVDWSSPPAELEVFCMFSSIPWRAFVRSSDVVTSTGALGSMHTLSVTMASAQQRTACLSVSTKQRDSAEPDVGTAM
jgi:hypothetical protein